MAENVQPAPAVEQAVQPPPFVMKDCALIRIATGKRAANLRELREQIESVSIDSIYHHFWGGRLQPSFEAPEFHNDFATWAHRYLHDEVVAERLSIIDPMAYPTLEDLRKDLIEVLEERLDEVEQPYLAPRDCQFEFIRSQIIIFDTHQRADHPKDLGRYLPHMSLGSIFYHFIDARRRNPERTDDFSHWMVSFGESCGELCERIRQIDPYFSTLKELQSELIAVFTDFLGRLECEKCVPAGRLPERPSILHDYAKVVGEDIIEHLQQLAEPLRGIRVVNVNSTRVGGGVAEILSRMVPLMQELGINASWEVITGKPEFYQCTKSFHNALQGDKVFIPDTLLKEYEETNARNAEALAAVLPDAEVVFIHDPQPAALISHFPNRKGKWIWRCHIDVSRPFRPVWRYVSKYISQYDASVFSLPSFVHPLPHPAFLIPPSIDPLNEKNMELSEDEVKSVHGKLGLDPNRPMVLQVSRYDRFKDPVGVIEAYKLAKRFIPQLQLVLAGGEATDDPEGEAVLKEVRAAALDDPDVHVLLLPSGASRTINALQRAADIVLQKSIKEGFGLTVAETMWKKKPVIGGNTGGIRIQVYNHHTGFLVNTPEGAALRIRYLFRHRRILEEMGQRARQFVLDNFLITRHLREYLTLILAVQSKQERIELG